MPRLKAWAPAGRKNGSFLPHTASSGGLLVRKYSWNVAVQAREAHILPVFATALAARTRRAGQVRRDERTASAVERDTLHLASRERAGVREGGLWLLTVPATSLTARVLVNVVAG